MMNLYRPSDRGARAAQRRLFFATMLVVLIFAADIFSGGLIRRNIRYVAAPFMRAGTAVWSTITDSAYFSTRRTLEGQIVALREQIDKMQENQGAYNVLKQENEELRALVHLAEQSGGVTAPVISSLRSSPYGTFMIGAGTRDGIAQGNLVIAGAGFVIGRVSDVGVTTSLVTELFAPDSSIDALIDGAPVVAEGRGGGNAYARVSHGVPVQAGDPVTAPTLAGRPIGIVGSAQSVSTSAYSDVYIGIPLNLLALKYVYIEK